jgi:very-short-patch-repair endonuclease
MNQFDRARAFYDRYQAQIEATPRNEWAMDPYAWNEFGITMTPIEAYLWTDIRANNLVLYPQVPIDRYFADFANPRAGVIVECDGKAYHQDKTKDDVRQRRLEDLGWTVYRLTGSECFTEQDEETGESGYAYDLMRRIGERHRIKRNAATKDMYWSFQTGMFSMLDDIVKLNTP